MNEPRIFLVRVWQDEPRFRASARDAREEEMQWFETPEQMTAYLCRSVGIDAPPAPSAPDPTTPGGTTDDPDRS